MRKKQGFTLIELMITVTIIGIITSIAIPSYYSNVISSARRAEGMPALLDIMRAQENFYANNFTYTSDLTDLNYSDPSITDSDRYSISASICGAGIALTSCILLRATGINAQAGDGFLELDSIGNRNHNGGTDGWL